ncbi:DUF987 family protein [Edwardsiella hoshinae]|uniref:DUF987 family protein n=1 Tax=Edwardsiella hoshinae TaxID=93378 RepID=UPI003CC9148B
MTIHRRYPGLRIFRFDKGKYRWYGTLSHRYGKEVNDISGIGRFRRTPSGRL